MQKTLDLVISEELSVVGLDHFVELLVLFYYLFSVRKRMVGSYNVLNLLA